MVVTKICRIIDLFYKILGMTGLSSCADYSSLGLFWIVYKQPAAEIVAFRIGELRGLSRWRARMRRIGLHDTLMENAMENAGMLLVQVERLLRTLADTNGQVCDLPIQNQFD